MGFRPEQIRDEHSEGTELKHTALQLRQLPNSSYEFHKLPSHKVRLLCGLMCLLFSNDSVLRTHTTTQIHWCHGWVPLNLAEYVCLQNSFKNVEI